MAAAAITPAEFDTDCSPCSLPGEIFMGSTSRHPLAPLGREVAYRRIADANESTASCFPQ
jgi:hypothetical protein